MKRRLFIDSSVCPTEALLRKALGGAIKFYVGILSKSGAYRRQWQYSRGNGWILKVSDKSKALYYLIPFDEGVEISLTVRENERADFMQNAQLKHLMPQFESATRYSEGYALRFEIESSAECKSVAKFIDELIEMRSS